MRMLDCCTAGGETVTLHEQNGNTQQRTLVNSQRNDGKHSPKRVINLMEKHCNKTTASFTLDRIKRGKIAMIFLENKQHSCPGPLKLIFYAH